MDRWTGLPAPEEIRQAIELYLRHAYGPKGPPKVARYLPPQGFQAPAWLMGELVERTPDDVPVEQVCSFALRLGNSAYPHMKLRLSRLPKQRVYLFTVDCHDAFLSAPPDTPDHQALEELKRRNAQVARAIRAALDKAHLPTERNYLREKIDQARRRRSAHGPQCTDKNARRRRRQ